MILIVGAMASGKREFAQSLGYKMSDMSNFIDDDLPVFYDLQDVENPTEIYDKLFQKEVVICNEIGCGISPLKSSERMHREIIGRICCDLAASATCVYRVTFGIGQKIK